MQRAKNAAAEQQRRHKADLKAADALAKQEAKFLSSKATGKVADRETVVLIDRLARFTPLGKQLVELINSKSTQNNFLFWSIRDLALGSASAQYACFELRRQKLTVDDKNKVTGDDGSLLCGIEVHVRCHTTVTGLLL